VKATAEGEQHRPTTPGGIVLLRPMVRATQDQW